MFGSTSTPARLASLFSSTLILLLPALWNRFPILEWDTGGYLARWFEGYLVPSRSTTYGLFLTAGWPLDFWPVVILQALAAVWIVGLVLRTQRLSLHPVVLPLVAAALALTTSLPWIASELLTDIFAGLAVLALHALVWHGESLSKYERLALVIFIGFAGATHSATYAVLLALGAAALFFSWLSARLVPRANLGRMSTAIVLGALMLLATNFIVGRSFSWTPGGYGIAFGRMLQDGIVTRYLNDHCPDAGLKLCPYRQALPLDADEFLWDDSVFNKLGRFAGLSDEMRTIVLGSLRDYPIMQAKTALRDTADQLVKVRTGQGVVTTIWHTYGIIGRYTPSVVPAMQAARQQHGEIGFHAVNDIDVPVALASMALLPILILIGVFSGDFAELGSLAATIAVALLANAAFCGVISQPENRYGSRIVWIASFAIGLALWRAVMLARERTPALSSESASTV